MADVDIDPFGEHESKTEEPTDKNIPLDLVTPGRSTWDPGPCGNMGTRKRRARNFIQRRISKN